MVFKPRSMKNLLPLAALFGLILAGCSAGVVARENYLKEKVFAHVYKMPAKALHAAIKPFLQGYQYDAQVRFENVTYGEKGNESVTCTVFEVTKVTSRVKCMSKAGSFDPARSIFHENQLLRVVDKAAFDEYEAGSLKAQADAEAKEK